MSSRDEEVELARATIRAAFRGEELHREVIDWVQRTTDWFFMVVEGRAEGPSFVNDETVKIAVFLLGKEGCRVLLENNALLLLARLLAFATSVDARSLEEKLSIAIRSVLLLTPHVDEWSHFLEESTQPIHDKKERRNRRRALQHETRQRPADAVKELWSAAIVRLVSILLPSGAASLYLPKGGSMFVPKLQQLIDHALPSIGSWLEERLFQRPMKIDMLYWLFSALRFSLSSTQQLGGKPPALKNSSALGAQLEPAVLPLLNAFVPGIFSLGAEVRANLIAWKTVDAMANFLNETSVVSLVISGCCRLGRETAGNTHRSERELDELIDALGHDERLVRTIISRVVPQPDLPVSSEVGTVAVFFNLLVYGLKASASEIMTQGALRSFDWERAQQTALERVTWFVLSPYFDHALVELAADL